MGKGTKLPKRELWERLQSLVLPPTKNLPTPERAARGAVVDRPGIWTAIPKLSLETAADHPTLKKQLAL